jgi:CheY-like chemotaxis protein
VCSNIWALVVEDDAHQLMVISTLLRKMDIRCKRNTTESHVQEQALGMSPKPDFILIELDLMRGDPFAILDTLHRDKATAQIPVLAVGDEKWLYQQDRLRAAHCAGWITKPIPQQQFEQFIQRVLDGEDLWQERR